MGAEFVDGTPIGRRRPPPLSSSFESFAIDWDGLVNLWSSVFEDQMKVIGVAIAAIRETCTRNHYAFIPPPRVARLTVAWYQVKPPDHTFVMTTMPDMSPNSRREQIEVMFETFDVPCLVVETPGVLSLYAAGKQDGIVVDCGNRLAITAVSSGYVVDSARHRSFFGGLNLTENLRRLLMDRGIETSAGDMDQVRRMKEDHCYVLPYDETGVGTDHRVGVTLGGHRFDGGPELWRCPELLFGHVDGCGLHHHIAVRTPYHEPRTVPR